MEFDILPLDNHFIKHLVVLNNSYLHWTDNNLPGTKGLTDAEAAKTIHHAPYGILSHNGADDPLFNYANLSTQILFERSLREFMGLPSRYSAEPTERAGRRQLLQKGLVQGIITDYQGIRISATGKRFHIKNVSLWTLLDEAGLPCGQAAMIPEWEYIISD